MLIKLQLKTSHKINLYFWTLKVILKNKINNYFFTNPCVNYKITSRDITIPKGAFAHKKTKEQMRLSYRKTIISFQLPLHLSHTFISNKGCLSLLSKYEFPVANITQIKTTLLFE